MNMSICLSLVINQYQYLVGMFSSLITSVLVSFILESDGALIHLKIMIFIVFSAFLRMLIPRQSLGSCDIHLESVELEVFYLFGIDSQRTHTVMGVPYFFVF